jgi:16S rRNA (adenine1518-N6/adenine1519-N6)-dimethyltransferase
MHFVIKAGSFNPAPKVDSCFLSLTIRSKPAVQVKDEARLFKIIRTAFGQRRKTLRNSLKGVVPEAQLNAFFAETGLKPTVRPEQLSLEDFATLTNC